MKSLFVLCSHFRTTHTVNQFGANYKNKKIKIIVFSILPLIASGIFRNFYNKKNDITVNNKNFIYIKSYFELSKILNKSKNKSYFYNAANPSMLSTFIELFLINFKKFKKIQILGEISPTPKNNFLKEILYLYKTDKIILIRKIFAFLFYKIKISILNLLSINKSTLIFLDNKKYYEIFKNKNNFNIHKFDNENYSNYLKFKRKRKREKKKYIVFLDQDLDNNFDKSLSIKYGAKFNSELYWKKIDFFFFRIRETI